MDPATIITTPHGDITLGQIAEIQPGLGTIMIEYDTRFNNMWWSAQAANWDMTNYQINEMLEIQEVGEITRPAHAADLKAFENSFVTPLTTAATAQDLAAFTTAYTAAIGGCNACHAGSGKSFVKIIMPTASHFQNVDWAGQ